MKTIILKHRFLYLFIILGITFSYTSCKDDDDTEPTSTFLEMYGGTKWVNNEAGQIYLRINDGINNPYDLWWWWDDYGDDCYEFIDYLLGNDEISENSVDRLIITETDGDGITIFTIQGETLEVVTQGGDFDGFELNFNKSTVNIDDLVLCD